MPNEILSPGRFARIASSLTDRKPRICPVPSNLTTAFLAPGLTYVGLTASQKKKAIAQDDCDDHDLCDGLTLRQLIREHITSLPADESRDERYEQLWMTCIWPIFGRRRAASISARNVEVWCYILRDTEMYADLMHDAALLMFDSFEASVLCGTLKANPFWGLGNSLRGLLAGIISAHT